MWRHQPPALSPLTGAALLSGLKAALAGGDLVRERLVGLLSAERQPEDVLLTDSGTSALTLALKAVARTGRQPPVVALPAFSCFDVATAADGAGVQVALYDLDPTTLGPDWDSLDRALATGACAVVIVHLYGVPVDMECARRLAASRDAVVIEDAAQGAGTTVGGRAAGSTGSLAVLSYGRGKGLTGGGGGALLANDDLGTGLLRDIRGDVQPSRTGWQTLMATAAQWFLARPSLYWLPSGLPFLHLGETRYRPAAPARYMASSNAGILMRTWHDAPRETALRQRHAERLQQALRNSDAFEPIEAPHSGGWAGYLRLPAMLSASLAAWTDEKVAGRLGVMRGYPHTLDELPGFAARLVNSDEPLPCAKSLSHRLVTLPTHGLLEGGDIDALCAWITRAVPDTTPGT